MVLSQDPSKIKTALVVGPLIYGQGRGPVNTRSIQAPEIARNTLAKGHGFRLGKGLNSWSNVHVRDLSQLFFALLEQAASPSARQDLWNEHGMYIPENDAMVTSRNSSLSCVHE